MFALVQVAIPAPKKSRSSVQIGQLSASAVATIGQSIGSRVHVCLALLGSGCWHLGLCDAGSLLLRVALARAKSCKFFDGFIFG